MMTARHALACTTLCVALACGAAQADRVAEPFVVDAHLRARRTMDGRTISLGEVHTGDTLVTKDHVRVSIRASHAAHLYLAYCSQGDRDPRYRGLTVFPEHGSIDVVANELTIAPSRKRAIILDDKPGKETLYVVVSRSELSSSDAQLAKALDVARLGAQGECGAKFQTAIAGPAKPPPAPH